MNSALSAIREQNRLIAEQNALLMRIAENGQPQAGFETETTGLMTERDLSLILMSENIEGAIRNWNQLCRERAKRRGRR